MRISSAVLVQVKGLGFSFHPSVQALMSCSRAFTEVCTPRRMSLSVNRPNHRLDLVHPGRAGEGEVDVEAGVFSQPRLGLGGVVGGEGAQVLLQSLTPGRVHGLEHFISDVTGSECAHRPALYDRPRRWPYREAIERDAAGQTLVSR